MRKHLWQKRLFSHILTRRRKRFLFRLSDCAQWESKNFGYWLLLCVVVPLIYIFECKLVLLTRAQRFPKQFSVANEIKTKAKELTKREIRKQNKKTFKALIVNEWNVNHRSKATTVLPWNFLQILNLDWILKNADRTFLLSVKFYSVSENNHVSNFIRNKLFHHQANIVLRIRYRSIVNWFKVGSSMSGVN